MGGPLSSFTTQLTGNEVWIVHIGPITRLGKKNPPLYRSDAILLV